MTNNQISPIALTAGDPASISPIITLKAWLALHNTNHCFFVITDIDYLNQIIKKFNLNISTYEINHPSECTLKIFKKYLPILHIKNDNSCLLGKEDINNTPFILKSIDTAINLANQKIIKAMVTNPIAKHIINNYGYKDFYGHTDYLHQKSELATYDFPIMMLSCLETNIHTIPLTTHIALREVFNHINTDKIVKVISCIEANFNKLNIKKPQINILGLNPHCGENGTMGREEIDIIEPAINKLKQINIAINGPIPADTAFNVNSRDKIIIGMYHDQVLAPFKALYFDTGTNITLNLGFVRTSPDHGTAFNLLGNNINIDSINTQSLITSIKAINTLI